MIIKNVPSFQAAIKDVKKSALRAAIDTVNITAARARKGAQQNIKDQFTTRNTFTENSVRYTQSGKSVKTLAAVKSETGITERAGYMARQETGDTKKKPFR